MSSNREPGKVVFKLKEFRTSKLRPRGTGLRYAGDSQLGLDGDSIEPLDLERFNAIFGHNFADAELLETALTHRSMQASSERGHYERLEFLGDAVLDLAIAELLIAAHPDATEGELSKMRAALVNTSSLADIARSVDLGKFIRLSRGEMAAGGAERSSILADVVEAVIGALFCEVGYSDALDCIRRLFGDRISNVSPSDPKTELQEKLHALGKGAPIYKLECTEGPEHCPVFISVVEIDSEVMGRGSGATKKLSQQAAAAEALGRL
jgi:ribonuclease-3